MDVDMYNAAMKGNNIRYGDFSLVDHLKREEESGYQVTPNGNTNLHVAALFGQRNCVEEVLKITPALLCYKNNKNETALHIAAKEGKSVVVSKLLRTEGKETLVRMTDGIGDTALHKAVRSGRIDIVRNLMKLLLDPGHDFPANNAGETPLYLAAESGFHNALKEILKVCGELTYVAGPFNRTPLHAAVIQEHTVGSYIMDPDTYNAAMEGDFSLVDHRVENGYQVTPNGNTILHVAALFGQQDFVEEVLKITPTLLCYKNNKNETALHIAADLGHSEVVRKLLSFEGVETLVRMTDDIGDTALHKAVRSGHVDIVRSLMGLLRNPEHDFPANMVGETPLYLAAESSFHDALIELLNVFEEPTYVTGPLNRTPLHAAVIQEHTECARELWEWNKPLCEQPDDCGWNSLHYAVKQGMRKLVSDMLKWKKSLAYDRAGSENDWTTAFHIAASEGHKSMIHELLKHCPDCWDMVNSNGQNVLHVAILLNDHERLIQALFKLKFCNSLVDKADNEGNTPLHLLAVYGNYVPLSILRHPTAKKMVFNKQNQTPLDIASSRTRTMRKEKLVADLRGNNARLGQRRRHFEVKHQTKYSISKIHETRKDDDEGKRKTKREKLEIDKIMKSTQIQVVVATLIMAITFAAGFTLPGGLDNDDGPNKGMAILIKKAAFRVFVISDVVAFTCSAADIPLLYHGRERCRR